MTTGKLFLAAVAIVAAVFVLLPELSSSGQTEGEGLVQGLKPGEGRDLVLMNCVACHSTAIIISHRMSRRRWDHAITQMQEEDGLWPFSEEVRNAILDYLEATQGPMDSAELAESSPWAQPLYRPNPIW